MSAEHRASEGAKVIRLEAESLSRLADLLETDPARGQAFSDAVHHLVSAKGHVIVVGVGKSGHIGQKLASSFASTGTPSFFMHPTEASHGDLGMLTPHSVVVAISNSGESREMIDVLHFCRKIDVPVIGLTNNPMSTLGRASHVVLQLPNGQEACPNGLAPTTSTTNALAMGDALAVATMIEKGISRDDFGMRHPGGKLGRGLQTVADWLALTPNMPPTISADAAIEDLVMAISSGQSGCVAVTDTDGGFVGMVTDGDMRRAMRPDVFNRTAGDIMTKDPLTLSLDQRMADVIDMLTARHLSNAFVVEDGKPVAVVNMKALLVQGYL